MNKTTLILTIIFALFLYSCKSKKQLQTVENTTITPPSSRSPIAQQQSVNDIISQSIQQRSNFEWFSANLSGSYNSGSDRYNFGGQIRIKNGEVIWMSITFMGLMEVARLKVTPDSVFLYTHNQLERPQNTTLHDFGFFKEMTGIDLTFDMLQDILLGNYFIPEPNNRYSYGYFEGNFLFTDNRPSADLMFDFVLSNAHYKFLKLSMRDRENRSILINYDNYTIINDKLFPQNIIVRMTNPMEMELRLNYQRIQLNVPQNTPFNIPNSLRRN
jgi:hypothetical protein